MSVLELSREVDAIEGVVAPEERALLVGHREIFSRLKNQSDDGRLPGGILLHGPRGVGKATLAFALARHVLETTSDETPLRIKEQIAMGVHPNVLVLRIAPRDPKAFYTRIRIEEVRGLVHKLHQTRGRAGSRICIVDSIDDCTAPAANALLKVLEEPPADTHFMLISHRPGKLLPTIRSRCQAQVFRPLDEVDMTRVLKESGAGAEQVRQALALAGGRPRRALEALSMAENDVLQSLTDWLQSPDTGSVIEQMNIAETLAVRKNVMASGFAREILRDWIANETRAAVADTQGTASRGRGRLASANLLWEKANALFDDADSFNLDARQTLLSLLDAIKSHVQNTSASTITDNPE